MNTHSVDLYWLRLLSLPVCIYVCPLKDTCIWATVSKDWTIDCGRWVMCFLTHKHCMPISEQLICTDCISWTFFHCGFWVGSVHGRKKQVGEESPHSLPLWALQSWQYKPAHHSPPELSLIPSRTVLSPYLSAYLNSEHINNTLLGS